MGRRVYLLLVRHPSLDRVLHHHRAPCRDRQQRQLAITENLCEYLYPVEGCHYHTHGCFACDWCGFKAELLFHSILHCKRMDSTDSGFCILGHLYERPGGAFVDEEEREEN
jgi:hypothetical protein